MKKDFDGAALVITDPTTADEQAKRVVDGWFPDSPYHFTVTESTPTSLPESYQKKIKSLQDKTDGETFVLTVYPWAATSNTLHERPTNGQIPS